MRCLEQDAPQDTAALQVTRGHRDAGMPVDQTALQTSGTPPKKHPGYRSQAKTAAALPRPRQSPKNNLETLLYHSKHICPL